MRQRREDQQAEDELRLQLFIPGTRGIPEFKAIEYFALKRGDVRDPKEFIAEVLALLKLERDPQ